MTRHASGLSELPFEMALRIDDACDRFESAYRAGGKPKIEDFLAETTAALRPALFAELLRLEIEFQMKVHPAETPAPRGYFDRFPDYREEIEAVFQLPIRLSATGKQDSRTVAHPQTKAVAVSGEPAQELKLPFQLGEYRLDARIGHGGMGTVYRAVHQKLDRTAAVKLMQRERMLSPESISRFQREMRAVAKLNHPNIVMAYDAGESQGLHFLVMEYVPGWDLASVCQCFGTLPIPVACECIRQTARGLQEMSVHGLVHRDIKPSNLMLTKDGVVKLLDLGLAGLRDDGHDERITRDSGPMGTIEYMAPEQARQPHGVDIRADIYGLGCTLFRLLCGFSPFGRTHRNTVQLLMAHNEVPPPKLRDTRPEVPPALEELVNRMLHKRPEDRPQSPEDVIRALEPFGSGSLMKSFALAVQSISDRDGKLPKAAPAGVWTGTDSWQPPLAESSPPEIVMPVDFGPPPAVGNASGEEPPPFSRRQMFGSTSRRTWLFLAGVVSVGSVGSLFWKGPKPRGINLLRNFDAKSPLQQGTWTVTRTVLQSPETGPGVVCLTQQLPADYRLDFTVKLIAGKLRWSIVSMADPRFTIDFGVGTIPAEDAVPDSQLSDTPHLQGGWGDGQYRITVQDRHLTLTRQGEQSSQLDRKLSDDEPATSEWLSPAARKTEGLYIVTEDTKLEFRQFFLTLLGEREGY